MNSSLKVMIILVLSVIYFAAAKEAELEAKNSKKEGIAIRCHLSYTPPTEGAEVEERQIKLNLPGTGQEFKLGPTEKFKDMAFATRYAPDYLAIDIVNLTTKKRICHHVYQFGNEVVNQFEGDNGFTGLVYVFHPDSKAELQFYCESIEK